MSNFRLLSRPVHFHYHLPWFIFLMRPPFKLMTSTRPLGFWRRRRMSHNRLFCLMWTRTGLDPNVALITFFFFLSVAVVENCVRAGTSCCAARCSSTDPCTCPEPGNRFNWNKSTNEWRRRLRSFPSIPLVLPCKQQSICLWWGPYQTGRVQYPWPLLLWGNWKRTKKERENSGFPFGYQHSSVSFVSFSSMAWFPTRPINSHNRSSRSVTGRFCALPSPSVVVSFAI